jgi:cell fate (sporulation/competence/biofilm development) regulator YlbF (YheA/YmcA/DUF963 family)
MTTATATTPLLLKTRELCQTLLDQPEFQEIRRSLDTFMADEQAKSQYQSLMEKGEQLQHKQQMGVTLENAEVAEFETHREALVSNPVARNFLEAQQAMHRMQESVNAYVSKTFELGRVPEAEDFDAGSCGPSCGCH